ncbi:Uncharacterised protein [Legionella waltersii]|nr:Uncharacterised protein [Legionella waltersii]
MDYSTRNVHSLTVEELTHCLKWGIYTKGRVLRLMALR